MPQPWRRRARQRIADGPCFAAMKRLKVYTLKQCSTCRDATKWLRERGIEFDELAIRETPPSPKELQQVLAAHDGEVRRLFNTSGIEYRAQKLADRVGTLTPAEAIATLAGNGSLVKRPFVVGEGIALVGFNEAKWAAALK